MFLQSTSDLEHNNTPTSTSELFVPLLHDHHYLTRTAGIRDMFRPQNNAETVALEQFDPLLQLEAFILEKAGVQAIDIIEVFVLPTFIRGGQLPFVWIVYLSRLVKKTGCNIQLAHYWIQKAIEHRTEDNSTSELAEDDLDEARDLLIRDEGVQEAIYNLSNIPALFTLLQEVDRMYDGSDQQQLESSSASSAITEWEASPTQHDNNGGNEVVDPTPRPAAGGIPAIPSDTTSPPSPFHEAQTPPTTPQEYSGLQQDQNLQSEHELPRSHDGEAHENCSSTSASQMPNVALVTCHGTKRKWQDVDSSPSDARSPEEEDEEEDRRTRAKRS